MNPYLPEAEAEAEHRNTYKAAESPLASDRIINHLLTYIYPSNKFALLAFSFIWPNFNHGIKFCLDGCVKVTALR